MWKYLWGLVIIFASFVTAVKEVYYEYEDGDYCEGDSH